MQSAVCGTSVPVVRRCGRHAAGPATPGCAPGVVHPARARDDEMSGGDAGALGEAPGEARGVLRTGAVVALLVGDEPVVAPERAAIGTPVAAERPARQRLARIPLALCDV